MNPERPSIAIVGLWHLGCVLAASWSRLGFPVTAIDPRTEIILGLRDGHPPVYEPDLAETLHTAVRQSRLSFSTSLEAVQGCDFVFVAYDTDIRDDDTSDPSLILDTCQKFAPSLSPDAIVIISAQTPVGFTRHLRTLIQQRTPSAEVVYSPENLRLGEALRCYLRPGHVVIGSESETAGNQVEELFGPMQANCLRMDLASAELAKHALNSFLALSITFANQLADLADVVAADFEKVTTVLKQDPRVGSRAYLTPGIGFSGGTLGRDLQVLEEINRDRAAGMCPIFADVWRQNRSRYEIIRRRCEQLLGSVNDKNLALLGMTYKAGTSTLRRSLPLEIGADLAARGAVVRAFDPKANWSEAQIPEGVTICASPYEAAERADALIFLTEWPEFLELDFRRLQTKMRGDLIFDAKNALGSLSSQLRTFGFRFSRIGGRGTT